ncbi:P-loop containing nucleoside triphosphate hydrolase protein [Gaertneriomyces semiglobifer]|nr:P-loop containing nucleoside triphosphate hydrolase protein [Gaertneriomyces semiglobifer]
MEKLCHAVVVYWNTLNPRPPTITLSDFQHALTLIRPASLGDLTSSIPKTSFMDLFGLEAAIQRIQLTVLKPFSDQGYYRSFGIGPPKGVLIYGPSGVGKSLLSYAIVHESGFNCVHVDGPKIRSRVVGESEQNIARIFAQARAAAPCILLIDNIDTVVPARGSDLTSENTGERIVTSFLTEMDGLFSKAVEDIGRQVFIVATTNRRGHIDPAILRPGRLDEHIHIPIPDNEARRDIFKGCLQKMPHSITAQDLDDFVTATVGYTGADIENVCREAAFNTLRKDLNSQMITKEDIIISMRR